MAKKIIATSGRPFDTGETIGLLTYPIEEFSDQGCSAKLFPPPSTPGRYTVNPGHNGGSATRF